MTDVRSPFPSRWQQEIAAGNQGLGQAKWDIKGACKRGDMRAKAQCVERVSDGGVIVFVDLNIFTISMSTMNVFVTSNDGGVK
jgi:hypothetical protein